MFDIIRNEGGSFLKKFNRKCGMQFFPLPAAAFEKIDFEYIRRVARALD